MQCRMQCCPFHCQHNTTMCKQLFTFSNYIYQILMTVYIYRCLVYIWSLSWHISTARCLYLRCACVCSCPLSYIRCAYIQLKLRLNSSAYNAIVYIKSISISFKCCVWQKAVLAIIWPLYGWLLTSLWNDDTSQGHVGELQRNGCTCIYFISHI